MQAISFVPCFKYADSEDVILFASSNIRYLVDQGGQFCTDYYGMKHELIECINSVEVFVDLNDEQVVASAYPSLCRRCSLDLHPLTHT